VKALSPSTPAMFFSADEDNNKVLCMAQVPKEIISAKGLKANEWCQQVQSIISGKGGGKPENAQASGSNPAGMNEAIKVAIAYAETKLGVKMPNLHEKRPDNDEVNLDDFVMVEKPTNGAGKEVLLLNGRIGTPNVNMILVAAKYAQVELQLVSGDQEVTLKLANSSSITKPAAILHYIASCSKINLLANQDRSQVLQWIFHAIECQSLTLSWVLKKRRDTTVLQQLEDYLRTRTYLAGERLSLADISMSMSIMPIFQFVLEEKEQRSNYPNTTRWLKTCLNQREFLSTLGTIQLK